MRNADGRAVLSHATVLGGVLLCQAQSGRALQCYAKQCKEGRGNGYAEHGESKGHCSALQGYAKQCRGTE